MTEKYRPPKAMKGLTVSIFVDNIDVFSQLKHSLNRNYARALKEKNHYEAFHNLSSAGNTQRPTTSEPISPLCPTNAGSLTP